MKRPLAIAALFCAASALAVPAVASAATYVSFTLQSAPPAARYEGVPAPRRGHVWVPGFWNWDGQRYLWQDGHWEMERAGYQYVAPEWVRVRDGWQLREGGWQPTAVAWNVVNVAPPPPRYEPVPYARPGFIWSPGHWEWYGQRYEWVPGSWLAERPGQMWSAPRWTMRDGRWNWEPGRWQARDGRVDRDHDGIDDRAEYYAYRDRDHDGVPDRYERERREHAERAWRERREHEADGRDRDHDGIPDRYEDRRDHDRDHDGVPNRIDADRDGDGVPNRYDRAPDNPYRR